MTLHADVPEFVPSSAAAPPFIPSSASLSSLAPPNEHGSTRGRKLSASSASSSHTGAGEGSTHLARSISSSSNGAGETSSQGGHARSHSVPHHSSHRGGSIPRGASREYIPGHSVRLWERLQLISAFLISTAKGDADPAEADQPEAAVAAEALPQVVMEQVQASRTSLSLAMQLAACRLPPPSLP